MQALQTFTCVCLCVSLVNIQFAQIIMKRNNKLSVFRRFIDHKNPCVKFAYYRGDIFSTEMPLMYPTAVKHL
jgi:hypothetical protein